MQVGFSETKDFTVSELEGKIFSVIKPVGITSFDVIREIRKSTGIKKIGHAGTLDPFAEGILIVGIGRPATKRLGDYLNMDKEYECRVVLGIETDTYDLTGKITERKPVPRLSKSDVEEVFSRYIGEIDQFPPIYSAIKVKGIRMYKAARSGAPIEIKSRKVSIISIELVDLLPDGFKMIVNCSKGTYIRSLAHDIGKELGTVAHLSKLKRTRIGEFRLEDSIELNVLIEKIEISNRGI